MITVQFTVKAKFTPDQLRAYALANEGTWWDGSIDRNILHSAIEADALSHLRDGCVAKYATITTCHISQAEG